MRQCRPALLVLAATAVVWAGCRPPDRAADRGGEPAPGFKLPTAAGGTFEIDAQRGRSVVLVFSATWCKYCKDALAALEPERQRLAARGAVIAEIVTDPENREPGASSVHGGLVLLDAGGGVAQKYGVEGIPVIVVVGPDGRVRYKREGYNPRMVGEILDLVSSLAVK